MSLDIVSLFIRADNFTASAVCCRLMSSKLGAIWDVSLPRRTYGPAQRSIGFQPVRADRSMSRVLINRQPLSDCLQGVAGREQNTGWKPMLVRLKVRANSGVEVPIGQSTGCP